MIEINNILAIYKDVIKKKTKNKERIYKMMNIEKVYNELNNINYDGGYYNIFLINRIIMSLNIKDKLINHYVTTYFLYPNLEKRLIDRNVATRKNKGRDYAIKHIKKDIEVLKKKKEFYILKLDIAKYFYSIDHNKLKDMLKEDLNDE